MFPIFSSPSYKVSCQTLLNGLMKKSLFLLKDYTMKGYTVGSSNTGCGIAFVSFVKEWN